MPTIDLALTGMTAPLARQQVVVEHPVGLVPHPLGLERLSDARVVLEELEHQVGAVPAGRCARARPRSCPSTARRRPSSRWRPTARGPCRAAGASGRSGRCCPGRGSRPRTGCCPGVFPVHPPGEVDQQLVEDPGEEVEVPAAVEREHLERRPRLDRRVDVAEVPLVGGQRPVRVLEPLPAEQHQLVLGEPGVDVGQRHAVEGQVPGGEPRVLPLVGHRQDVEGVEVPPARVAPVRAPGGGPAGPGRRPARSPRRSCRTAWTRASRRTPAA